MFYDDGPLYDFVERASISVQVYGSVVGFLAEISDDITGTELVIYNWQESQRLFVSKFVIVEF